MFLRLALAIFLLSTALFGQPNDPALERHVRAEMSFLASDALAGRGSATRDEWIAATYVVSQFQAFGLDTAEVQRVPLRSGYTWNAIGILRGSDPQLASQTILLSSHLDHLGTRHTSTGDIVFHGADDDASGTTAVLELARALASRTTRPRRTILFVCFGSEETGGHGDRYFLEHPPLLLSSIVANLEFEMIGLPDPAVATNQLWLTGWDRSNLGPALAQHGAPLTADPHPGEHFFERSDNIALAHRGIVAQTISSYGLGAHYHQPTDDLARINFPHLTHAIASTIPAIEWLANTDWQPSWNPGGKP